MDVCALGQIMGQTHPVDVRERCAFDPYLPYNAKRAKKHYKVPIQVPQVCVCAQGPTVEVTSERRRPILNIM